MLQRTMAVTQISVGVLVHLFFFSLERARTEIVFRGCVSFLVCFLINNFGAFSTENNLSPFSSAGFQHPFPTHYPETQPPIFSLEHNNTITGRHLYWSNKKKNAAHV